jgi:hypothetical protein
MEFNSNIILTIIAIALFFSLLFWVFDFHISVVKYIKKDTRIVKNIFTGKKYLQIYDDGWDSKFDYKYYKYFKK